MADQPLDHADVHRLKLLHQERRLQLTTTVGLFGAAHLGGDPQHLVTELLRLAAIGARAQARTEDS